MRQDQQAKLTLVTTDPNPDPDQVAESVVECDGSYLCDCTPCRAKVKAAVARGVRRSKPRLPLKRVA